MENQLARGAQALAEGSLVSSKGGKARKVERLLSFPPPPPSHFLLPLGPTESVRMPASTANQTPQTLPVAEGPGQAKLNHSAGGSDSASVAKR